MEATMFEDPRLIGLLAILFVVILVMRMGRKVRYVCMKCGTVWKGVKHHGQTAPRCPGCGSSDVRRK